jgi:hypothetical protein
LVRVNDGVDGSIEILLRDAVERRAHVVRAGMCNLIGEVFIALSGPETIGHLLGDGAKLREFGAYGFLQCGISLVAERTCKTDDRGGTDANAGGNIVRRGKRRDLFVVHQKARQLALLGRERVESRQNCFS